MLGFTLSASSPPLINRHLIYNVGHPVGRDKTSVTAGTWLQDADVTSDGYQELRLR